MLKHCFNLIVKGIAKKELYICALGAELCLEIFMTKDDRLLTKVSHIEQMNNKKGIFFQEST